MKICYSIIIFTLSNLLLFSQVGINTSYPYGIFMLDAESDNPKNEIPTEAQQLNDFVITGDQNGESLVGVGIIPPTSSSSQLELKAPNKALLLK